MDYRKVNVKCKVDGCDKEARYKTDQVCQKHYFRFMRNGTYCLKATRSPMEKRPKKYRVQNPAGYQKINVVDHPLGTNQGYIYEHRKVIFDLYGWDLPDCEICGKPTNWSTCHIDHKDNDVTNNLIENLRPVCNPCNTRRFYPLAHSMKGRYAITFDGDTKTPTEWARDERVNICGHQIVIRKLSGMTDEDALFSPKKTHNGNGKNSNPKAKAKIKALKS